MNINENISIEAHDLKWVLDLFRAGRLVVDNSFQRNSVWLSKHKVSLIETILTGFTFPEIYLWTIGTDPNTGDTKYSIIDGQQRITSITEYIENDFKLTKSYLDDKNQEAEFVNKRFRELDDDNKNKIWRFKVSVRIVSSTVPRPEIVEMFLRLNSTSMSLNPQELRNAAFNGLFIELAESISDLDFWDDKGLFTSSDRRRMQDIQFVSNVLMFFRQGIGDDLTQSDYNRIYDLYNEEYDEKDADKEKFENILIDVNRFFLGDDSDRTITLFLRRKTHLYALMLALHSMQIQDSDLTEEGIHRYRLFVENYGLSDEELKLIFDEEMSDRLLLYKEYSLQGTQKKLNRLNRINVIKGLLEGEPAQVINNDSQNTAANDDSPHMGVN